MGFDLALKAEKGGVATLPARPRISTLASRSSMEETARPLPWQSAWVLLQDSDVCGSSVVPSVLGWPSPKQTLT